MIQGKKAPSRVMPWQRPLRVSCGAAAKHLGRRLVGGGQGAGQLRPSQPRTSGAPASLGGAQLACALAPEDRRTCLSWHAMRKALSRVVLSEAKDQRQRSIWGDGWLGGARAQASCAPPNHEPVVHLRRWEGRNWPAPWPQRTAERVCHG